MSLLRRYLNTSLMLRMFGGFLLGSALGVGLWILDAAGTVTFVPAVARVLSPFGTIFVNMLKMVVIPVVFLSLLVGAASLPLRRFGRIGLKVVGWYLLTSLLAAVVGVALALALDPGRGVDLTGWESLAASLGDQTEDLASRGASATSLSAVLVSMFQNPFRALAEGSFLPIIVFAILFGLGLRVTLEAREDGTESGPTRPLTRALELVSAARDVMFRIVDWILEYAPVGVFALSLVNFALYGPAIVGPYVKVVLGVVAAILTMVFVVYAAMVAVVLRRNPYTTFLRIRQAMFTAFVTRSSAATLPVSIKVVRERLGVREELASFSLPLGATINMDGVCVHLPMFALLAANMFGLEVTPVALFVMVITTVLAAIGAGGVPGGSLMLLFIILETLGLDAQQVAVVVALALGVNPILDMFETMNNVTGDLVCTHVVAEREGLVHHAAEGSTPDSPEVV